ncbi:hypothetical protein Lalb_Chr15g0081101 [Lupinus albus]|uniref:Uncharacterized protein n=1 Tax=Lupinus albus TaxID=3870 RepID=A0A6A4PD59_LUPAL|nr:hypothetical protein Lalb_Chr15g0081101 [Lupinus albus]
MFTLYHTSSSTHVHSLPHFFFFFFYSRYLVLISLSCSLLFTLSFAKGFGFTLHGNEQKKSFELKFQGSSSAELTKMYETQVKNDNPLKKQNISTSNTQAKGCTSK